MGSAREALAEDEEAPTARGMLTDDGQTVTKKQQKDSIALAFGGATTDEAALMKQYMDKHPDANPDELLETIRANPKYEETFGRKPPK